MKNSVIALGKVLFVTFLLTFVACKSGKKEAPPPIKINPGFSEYISAYTSGIISSKSSIRIKLSSQLEQDVEPGTYVKTNFFSFSPKIEGKVFWVDNRTLELRPEKDLLSGQIYEGKFHLNKLIDVPSDFTEFPIQFQTIKQNFRISKITLDPYNLKDLKYNKLQGVFETADYLENSIIEEIVSASLEGKAYKVKNHAQRTWH